MPPSQLKLMCVTQELEQCLAKEVDLLPTSLGPKHQALPIYEKEMLEILTTVIKWNSYM